MAMLGAVRAQRYAAKLLLLLGCGCLLLPEDGSAHRFQRRILQPRSRNLFSEGERLEMSRAAKEMFYHGYNNYIWHALPHDELKPLSKNYTDSLAELGNLDLRHLSDSYQGVAMTLIDSLSTLAVLEDAEEFASSVEWLSSNLSFDQDVRVNVFEANIRLLGGLLSGHLLASDEDLRLLPGYKGELLGHAQDLGDRLLLAFSSSPTGLPYAWVNLRHGVREDETTETNTAACGSLILEMGMLSRLTGNAAYWHAALEAIRVLWAMRSEHNLLGTTLNMSDASWLSTSGGIGASADSFYEYMLKAYLLFGDHYFYDIFQQAYEAAIQTYKNGPWYHESDIYSRQPTHLQFTSLQGFWPGLQVLVGDIPQAEETFEKFAEVWRLFGLPPERFLWNHMTIHSTERHYPLRPELVESAYHLFTSTRDPKYRVFGRTVYDSLLRFTKVNGGHANIRSVLTKEKEDHMPSYFLAETCKYLYLLFNDTFLQGRNFVFTTEGHLFPVMDSWPGSINSYSAFPLVASRIRSSSSHGAPEFLSDRAVRQTQWPRTSQSALQAMLCPAVCRKQSGVRSACEVQDTHHDHRCIDDHECGVDPDTCIPRVCSSRSRCASSR